MSRMFYNCPELKTIYVSNDWTVDNVTASEAMFLGCTKLVGGQGTTYNNNKTDNTYAHIDGDTSNPGYLTAELLRGDVNNDGQVNIADVTALVNIILSKINEDQYNPVAADLNADGQINIADVTLLVNILLEKG